MSIRHVLTTESGRVYHVDLDDGFWSRAPHHYPHRIWQLKASSVMEWPWTSGALWEDRLPKIGEHLFIAGKDEWYCSNKIVSIELVDYIGSDAESD